MWNPGFSYLDTQKAKMFGVHRAPCIYSWVHRGTKQRPGIVLGLAQGGACVGQAFKINNEDREKTLDYLRARELVTDVYLERTRPLHLQDGERVSAITYIADNQHEQYAGRLSREQLVAQITGAVGQSGPNESYIIDTNEHLLAIGIKDNLMQQISANLKAKAAR